MNPQIIDSYEMAKLSLGFGVDRQVGAKGQRERGWVGPWEWNLCASVAHLHLINGNIRSKLKGIEIEAGLPWITTPPLSQ